MKLAGHVKLHRKLKENPIWTQLSPAVLKVFVYFITEANWKPEPAYDGAQQITIPVGSFVTSYQQVSQDCALSLQQVRDAFVHLEKLGVSTYRRTPRHTVVTVKNYGRYNSTEDERNTAENRQGVPEHSRNIAGTESEHSPAHKHTGNSDNSSQINNHVGSNTRPLKEQEVKKGRIEEPPPTPSPSVAVMPAQAGRAETDLFAVFWEVFVRAGKPLNDRDKEKALRKWLCYDEPEQLRIIEWVMRQALTVWRDPHHTPSPYNALESNGWTRKAEPRSIPTADEKDLEAIRLFRERQRHGKRTDNGN